MPTDPKPDAALDQPLSDAAPAAGWAPFDGGQPGPAGAFRGPGVPSGEVQPLPDPASVVTRNDPSLVSARLQEVVRGREGAPKTAEVVARLLAQAYGPYSAANSEENRQAIIGALRWVADVHTGLRYDDARSDGADPMTQSPNETLSKGSGVCRDIHTATSALLASLMAARHDEAGWVPGSPTGQEAQVQTLSFATPTEYHAFMVYREPVSGGWDALEYGKSYALRAASAEDALRALPGYVSGFQRYRLTGWDGRPVLAEAGAMGAEAAREFLGTDEGTGAAGEVRLGAASDGVKVTGFLTPELSLTSKLGPSLMGNGLDGGVKFNFHRDFDWLDATGHVRLAGGVYTQGFEASRTTGQRAVSARAPYRSWVLGFQVDGDYQGRPRELIGEHLKASFGIDFDAMLGVPLGPGPGASGAIWGAVPDFSQVNVGAQGVLSGREHVSDSVTVDWAVRTRYQADLVKAGVELVTSAGSSARNLGPDAVQADFALALTYKSPTGVTTRFEAGGTHAFGSPLDPQSKPSGTHYAVLSVAPDTGVVNFGITASGEQLDSTFIPVNAIGVALNLRPSKDVEVGVGVTSVFPDGNVRNFGNTLQVMAGLTVHL